MKYMHGYEENKTRTVMHAMNINIFINVKDILNFKNVHITGLQVSHLKRIHRSYS